MRNKARTIALILAASMAASMVLAGCGSKESETGSGSAGSGTSAEQTAENRTIKYKELMSKLSYDPKDYVDLMDDYETMKVTLTGNYNVTDESIEQAAQMYLSYFPTYYVANDKQTVEDGDTVDIDYEGKIDGEVFDGGSAEGHKLEIGSGSFIDGFETGLIGASVGDTVTLDLTFPEDYQSEDLAGKAVEFTVTVNEIGENVQVTYETITDEYVNQNFASYFGWTTVDEMKEGLAESVSSDLQNQQSSDLQNEVLTKLVENSTITIPDGLVEEQYQTNVEAITKSAADNDMELEEYISTYYSMEMDEFETELRSQIEEAVKQELVLNRIIQDTKMSIESADFDAFVDNVAANYGYESAQAVFDDNGGEDYVMMIFARNQALTNLLENVRVTFKLDREALEQDDAEAEEDETATGDTATEEETVEEETAETETAQEETAEE